MELDAYAVRAGRATGAGEDELVPGLHAPLDGVARQPQLRPLQVEQQAQRAPRPSGRRAHLGRPPPQVFGVAVRAIQTRTVQAGGDQPVEHPGTVRRGAQGRHDLRSPLEHAAQSAIPGWRSARNPGLTSQGRGSPPGRGFRARVRCPHPGGR